MERVIILKRNSSMIFKTYKKVSLLLTTVRIHVHRVFFSTIYIILFNGYCHLSMGIIYILNQKINLSPNVRSSMNKLPHR